MNYKYYEVLRPTLYPVVYSNKSCIHIKGLLTDKI